MKLRTFFYKSQIKHITNTFTNSNIIYMKKIDDARNSTLKIKQSQNNLFFQTIWSNFMHTTAFLKNHSNTNFPKNDIDYSNLSEDSYIIFQNDNQFFDYNTTNNDFNLTDDKKNNIELNLPKNNDNCLVINRIPQEFSLNITANKNITINNTGDSKLMGNVNVNFISDLKNFNNFETKRIRSENFSISCENGNLSVMIKSSLEVENLKLSANLALIKIKKLGLVKAGIIKSNIAEIDIRSIYCSLVDRLTIEVDRGLIELGNCQGNMKIVSKEAKIVIDSIDCTELDILSENSEITVFFNKIENYARICSSKGQVNLFLNSDNADDFNIYDENRGEYLMKSKNEENKKIIKINSENVPKIVCISAWDYIKEKIERKVKNRQNKL